jgi:ABC-2 type transport system ATP-binding protein
LIINHGRLVVESPLADITARVGGSVRVRCAELTKLADALGRAQITTETSNDHALIAHGTTSDGVGDVAFAAGIAVHELVAEGSSLEEVFLELTAASPA